MRVEVGHELLTRNLEQVVTDGNEPRRGDRVLGGLGRMALGRVGGVASVVAYPMTDMLSDAIVNLLDCREQQKAAAATDEAIRGGPGTTVNWTSESRQSSRSPPSTDTPSSRGPDHSIRICPTSDLSSALPKLEYGAFCLRPSTAPTAMMLG